jgi:hypothetical protein
MDQNAVTYHKVRYRTKALNTHPSEEPVQQQEIQCGSQQGVERVGGYAVGDEVLIPGAGTRCGYTSYYLCTRYVIA